MYSGYAIVEQEHLSIRNTQKKNKQTNNNHKQYLYFAEFKQQLRNKYFCLFQYFKTNNKFYGKFKSI